MLTLLLALHAHADDAPDAPRPPPPPGQRRGPPPRHPPAHPPAHDADDGPLPPWVEKRAPASGWTVGVNAYVGAFAGVEHVDGENVFSSGWSFGPVATIGGELGHALPGGGYVGLYASVIDVGALAAFRAPLGEDDPTVTITDAERSAWQVFTPGGGIVAGVKGAPLAFMAAVSRVQGLRHLAIDSSYVDDTGNTVLLDLDQDSAAWRFGLSVLVDVPVRFGRR